MFRCSHTSYHQYHRELRHYIRPHHLRDHTHHHTHHHRHSHHRHRSLTLLLYLTDLQLRRIYLPLQHSSVRLIHSRYYHQLYYRQPIRYPEHQDCHYSKHRLRRQ